MRATINRNYISRYDGIIELCDNEVNCDDRSMIIQDFSMQKRYTCVAQIDRLYNANVATM